MKESFNHIHLYIEGMVCVSCEKTLENGLLHVQGVENVTANQSKGTLSLSYDSTITNLEEIQETIEFLGYLVSKQNKQKNFFSKLLGFASILLIIFTYLIVESRLSFNFVPQIRQSMGYGTLFVVGLLTSIHCIAMCGGITISQCSHYKKANDMNNFYPSLLYNLGRVLSYTVIGSLVGGLGSVISFNGQLKGYLTLIISIFMMLMALRMLNLFSFKFLRLRFGGRLKINSEKSKNSNPFIIGILNGFMPCGPLQSMQLYALGTGSILVGGLSMFYFSLGTVPLMFGLGALSTYITGKFSMRVMKFSALLVFLLSLSMFSRGASLAGLQLPFSSDGDVAIAEIVDNKQVVKIDLDSSTYTPIKVRKDIPVKWIIEADIESINGCNNPLTIPEYKIEKTLETGENIITFIPNQEGKIIYTCWMGMITSYIEVIDE